MLHRWSLETDGNRATVRTPFFDYRKAFDLIDHSILVNKLRNLAVTRSVVNWLIDFLSNRFQRRLLLQVGPVPSGILQGYQIGPWFFVLMINDLDANTPHVRKFVDDTTVSEVVPKGITNEAQSIVNQVIEWSHVNRVQLNPGKCMELRTSFARNPIDRTSRYRQVIGTYCKREPNIEEAVKKASKRLYFLVQLKLSKLPPTDRILFYNTCVRSVIDYVQVFYNDLSRYLINELVRIEKKAISIIMHGTTYNNACKILAVTPMVYHIDTLCDNLFHSIASDKNHRLDSLFPPL